MSERRQAFLLDVAQLLADAEALAEGNTVSWDPRVRQGKDRGGAPAVAGSTLDDVYETLRPAVRQARRLVDQHRKRAAAELTADQQRYWLDQDVARYAGWDYTTVAQQLQVHATQVWASRKRLQVDPRSGRVAA